MEQWEIELRARLEKELPGGIYEINNGKFKMWTGKGGAIEYYVALNKEVKGMISKAKNKSVKQQIKDAKNTPYKHLTKEKIEEVLNDIFYNN